MPGSTSRVGHFMLKRGHSHPQHASNPSLGTLKVPKPRPTLGRREVSEAIATPSACQFSAFRGPDQPVIVVCRKSVRYCFSALTGKRARVSCRNLPTLDKSSSLVCKVLHIWH